MKTEASYGAEFAAVMIVYTMVEHLLGLNSANHAVGQYTRLFGVLLPPVATFMGMRARKRLQKPGAPFTFGRGLRSGFLIALVLSVLTSVWFLLYGNVINPDFLPTLLQFEKHRLLASGTPDPDVAAHLESLRTMYTLPIQPIAQSLVGTGLGTVFAAVFAFFMKSRTHRPAPSA